MDQVELMRCFLDVILLDATRYKTNRYGMPLLQTAAMNTFFSSGFCFLGEEAEEDHFWAIERFNDAIRAQEA